MGEIFSKAIVCPPAANFAEGLTSVSLGVPVFEKALGQHWAYCEALRAAGLDVIELAPDPAHPDSTFVEDPAVITPDWAVLTRPGAPTRTGEVVHIAGALAGYFASIDAIEAPGTLDGGDICQIEDHFMIGISERTNDEGARQLAGLLTTHGCTSEFVDIRGRSDILHLKSGIAYIGDNRLLVIESLADKIPVNDLEPIIVPAGEEYAANCIRVNDRVLMPAGFPRLNKILNDLNHHTVELDMSEFQKMDGGLSCLSLRF